MFERVGRGFLCDAKEMKFNVLRQTPLDSAHFDRYERLIERDELREKIAETASKTKLLDGLRAQFENGAAGFRLAMPEHCARAGKGAATSMHEARSPYA
ncbi:MAG: hypothetical protein V4710_22325, partial [Verrucomicrobiota bacterium]